MKKATMIRMTGALLILGLLAGCGANEATISDTSASVTEPTEVITETTPAPSEVVSAAETLEPQEASSEEEVSSEDSIIEEEAEEPVSLFGDYFEEPAADVLYAQVADSFQAMEYVDDETGLVIPYNFFIPAEAENTPCPMVMFISDSTSVGRDLSAPLTQGIGGTIWATPEEQAKHPSFVLIPEYPEIVIDDNHGETVSDYVEATARMIETVIAENNIDANRIYTTGQSMGCMVSLYLAANHPDLFAASLFVSGQWNLEDLPELGSQTFCYVAAAGDPKASAGQANVMAYLDEQGIPYVSSLEWDANLSDQDMEETLQAMFETESNIYIGQFLAGTVLEANPRGIEHMSSFDCAYKLDALRNWLFAQSKA